MKSGLQDKGVIEFFGLPGSGKTTAASALLDSGQLRSGRLSQRMVRLSGEGRLSRSLFKGRLIARHPVASARVLRECLHVRQHVDRGRLGRFVLSVLNMMFVASLLRSGRVDRALVLDQGFFQGCWAMLRVLQPARRHELKIEPLFGIAYSAFDSDQVHLVHVHSDGREARRRALIRAGLPDASGADAGTDIEQDEACMLLVESFIAHLLEVGAIGARHDCDDVLTQINLRTEQKEAR